MLKPACTLAGSRYFAITSRRTAPFTLNCCLCVSYEFALLMCCGVYMKVSIGYHIVQEHMSVLHEGLCNVH